MNAAIATVFRPLHPLDFSAEKDTKNDFKKSTKTYNLFYQMVQLDLVVRSHS